MTEQSPNLDQLLDAWQAPALGRDLTGAVLARARDEDRALDELLVRADPQATLQRDLTGEILARARAEDESLDRLLAAADEAPAMSGDLSRPVIRTIRRRRLTRRLAAVAGGLAAAAVLVVAILLHNPADRTPPRTPQNEPVAAKLFTPKEQAMLKQVDVDQLAKDLPVLVHWDTIRAMEQLEREASETNGLRAPDSTDG